MKRLSAMRKSQASLGYSKDQSSVGFESPSKAKSIASVSKSRDEKKQKNKETRNQKPEKV